MMNELEQLQCEYEELKQDWEEMSKQVGLLNYFRDLCDRQQKVLDILRHSPFILEKIFEDDGKHDEYNHAYFYGTITDDEVALIKKWLL